MDTAIELWKADMRRRTVITGAAWAMASFSPAQRWLQDPDDVDVSRVGRRRVGEASYIDEDVDHACSILRETLPAATGLTSTRGLDAVNALRRQLAEHSDRPAVRHVEADFRELVGTTA